MLGVFREEGIYCKEKERICMRLKSKRLISLLLAGSMMVSMVPASAVTAFAETTAATVVAENSNTETSGSCGATESDSVRWNYASGVLTISGTGAMKDYETQGANRDLAVDDNGVITTDTRPWAKYLNDIVELRVEGGITVIGKNALAYCKNLKKLNLDGVTGTISIHGAAFGFTGIEELDIPATVSEIGNYAFYTCKKLKKVTFRGQTKLLGTPFPNENALEELVIADNAVVTVADKFGNSSDGRPFGANTLTSLKKLELLGEFKGIDSATTTNNEELWRVTFCANTELTDVTVSGSNMQYVSRAAFPAIKTLNVVGGNATAKFMCTSGETNNTLENISIDVDTYTGVKEAFNGATALKTFVLKANTATLGDYEFGRDTSLKAIDLAQCGTVTYGTYCFGVEENAATNAVVYVKDLSTAPNNAPCAVLVVNGGNVDLTKEGFDSVTKVGYKAVWYEGENATTDTKPTAGKTYTAKWEAKKQYTVSFDLNGQTGTAPETQPVYEEDTATKPTDPTAKGYKFIGWCVDKDGNTAYDFAKPVTANTTLYAKWEAIPDHQLTVTGGTFTVKDETVEAKTEGDKLIADIPEGAEVTVTFNKAAYADSNLTFDGWKIEGLDDASKYTGETFTFTMPETGVTIEAQTKAKATDTDDDSLDAATVVTGVVLGTGTAILAYHIGTELYAEQVLGEGVAVPKTREDVALKAWELVGKPAVELNGEPLSEAAQAEKWAVESGLMQNDANGSFNGAKKMNKLKALRVLDNAKKMNAQ